MFIYAPLRLFLVGKPYNRKEKNTSVRSRTSIFKFFIQCLRGSDKFTVLFHDVHNHFELHITFYGVFLISLYQMDGF